MTNKATRPETFIPEKVFNDAYDNSKMGEDSVSSLCCLFKAIHDISGEYTQTRQLAKLGIYLCDDWSNLLETANESLDADIKQMPVLTKAELTKPQDKRA